MKTSSLAVHAAVTFSLAAAEFINGEVSVIGLGCVRPIECASVTSSAEVKLCLEAAESDSNCASAVFERTYTDIKKALCPKGGRRLSEVPRWGSKASVDLTSVRSDGVTDGFPATKVTLDTFVGASNDPDNSCADAEIYFVAGDTSTTCTTRYASRLQQSQDDKALLVLQGELDLVDENNSLLLLLPEDGTKSCTVEQITVKVSTYFQFKKQSLTDKKDETTTTTKRGTTNTSTATTTTTTKRGTTKRGTTKTSTATTTTTLGTPTAKTTTKRQTTAGLKTTTTTGGIGTKTTTEAGATDPAAPVTTKNGRTADGSLLTVAFVTLFGLYSI